MWKKLLLLAFVAFAMADLYMHNPRGSNNRNRGTGGNVANANRLFNSQNNGAGGYCWGPKMKFYAGSLLRVEWTNQHACGTRMSKIHCETILQYMCQPIDEETGLPLAGYEIRDGVTTNTIPDNEEEFNQAAGEEDTYGEFFEYGMHESYYYYQDCKTRERNKGLFIADRNVNGNSARFTRQNNNGNRRGFECPEERDYYPYWHPTPWKDIAIFTSDTDRCSYFQAESQNVKAKGYCMGDGANQRQPCEASDEGVWMEEPAWGISAPDCLPAFECRDNHLGNCYVKENDRTRSPVTANYMWQIPFDEESSACVLRMRYNMSSDDFDIFQDSTGNGMEVIYDDPNINVAPDDSFQTMNVSLAIDTSQYARTFQDRSHTFEIVRRPTGSGNPGARDKIYNLNVRGKRGNIVQTYPAVEYDFVPNHLQVAIGDWIHFQWTGCDTNPQGNAGEGLQGTDRSNIVQIANRNKNRPAMHESETSHGWLFKDEALRARFAWLDQTGCQTYEELKLEHPNDDDDIDRDPENCMKLNLAPAYFDGGLVKMRKRGDFHYMSSRNNNFSNRGQKATITVDTLIPGWAIGTIVGGSALVVVGGVLIGLKASGKLFV